MLAQYTGGLLAGAGNNEIAAEDFTSVGPALRAPMGGMSEIIIKSTTVDLQVRLGGIAGSVTTGFLGRLLLSPTLGSPTLRRKLAGTIITYGAARIHLGYHGRGDSAQSGAGYDYDIDMAYEPVAGTPRTLDELRAAISTQMAALSGVGTATLKFDSKQPGAIYIHDSSDPPTALTLKGSSGSSGRISAETPAAYAFIPVAVADCPFTLELDGAEVLTIHVADAGGATIVASAKFGG